MYMSLYIPSIKWVGIPILYCNCKTMTIKVHGFNKTRITVHLKRYALHVVR